MSPCGKLFWPRYVLNEFGAHFLQECSNSLSTHSTHWTHSTASQSPRITARPRLDDDKVPNRRPQHTHATPLGLAHTHAPVSASSPRGFAIVPSRPLPCPRAVAAAAPPRRQCARGRAKTSPCHRSPNDTQRASALHSPAPIKARLRRARPRRCAQTMRAAANSAPRAQCA